MPNSYKIAVVPGDGIGDILSDLGGALGWQAMPGVTVWRCGPESRLRGLPLAVFPGNVGGVDALSELL